VPRQAKFLAALVVGLAVLVTASAAQAQRGTVSILGPTPGNVGALAVDDANGNLYAVISDRVFVFDSAGADLFQFGLPGDTAAGGLKDAVDLAVDPTSHDAYVLEATNNRISKFDSAGNFVLAFGWNVNQTQSGSALETCPRLSFPADVCQAGERRTDSGAIGSPSLGSGLGISQQSIAASGIALGPGGNVYVAEPGGHYLNSTVPLTGNRRIQAFSPSGSLLSTFDVPEDPPGCLPTPGSDNQCYESFEPNRLAINNSQEIVYTSPGPCADTGSTFLPPPPCYLKRFTSDGSALGAFAVDNTFGPPIDLALDQSTGKLYAYQATGVGHQQYELAVYDGTGALDEEVARGLSVSGAGSVAVRSGTSRAYATDGGNHIFVIDNISVLPAATIEAPTTVTASSAELHGAANPNSAEFAAGYHFEYRAEGDSAWTSVSAADTPIAAGVSPVPAEQSVSGLDPNTTYHIRLVVSREFGAGFMFSAETTFTTDPIPPSVSLISASRVTDTTARLGALVNAEHAETTYYFQYGEDTSYGSFAPAGKGGDAGAGLGDVPAFKKVTGLQPDTTYHFCLVAVNIGGATSCEDQTFTTTTTAAQAWPERGFELVSSPDKGSQEAYRGVEASVLNPPVSSDGQRVVWSVTGGAPDATVGHQSAILSTRTPSGWVQKSLNPPASEQSEESFRYNPFAISRDLKTMVAVGDLGFGAVANTKESALVSLSAEHGMTTLIQPFDQADLTNSDIDASFDASTVVRRDHATGQLESFEDGKHVASLQIPSCGVDQITTRQYQSQNYTSVFPGHVVVESPDESNCSGADDLYMVDTRGGPFTLISGPPLSGPDEGAHYLRGNSDGTVVLFSTKTKLAAEDANSGRDVYRWEEGGGVTCMSCGTEADGVVPAGNLLTSEDLSHVYMKIPSGPVAFSDGEMHHVPVALAVGENGLQNPAQTSTKITPDGDAVLFVGGPGLTADKVPPVELYLYDDRDGRVECVSCSEDGLTAGDAHSFYSFELSADGSTAAWTSKVPLVAEDINNSPDVYEWHNGRVRLVTDGVTEWTSDPRFTAQTWGISADGRDLILAVPAPLTGAESDQFNQVYDARVGSQGFPVAAPPAHCSEDSCQGPLADAPALSKAASAGFAGSGNAVQAKGKSKKQRHRKRKAKHRRKASKAAKHKAKAGGNQGGQR
jgi:hypothetical protein